MGDISKREVPCRMQATKKHCLSKRVTNFRFNGGNLLLEQSGEEGSKSPYLLKSIKVSI